MYLKWYEVLRQVVIRNYARRLTEIHRNFS